MNGGDCYKKNQLLRTVKGSYLFKLACQTNIHSVKKEKM